MTTTDDPPPAGSSIEAPAAWSPPTPQPPARPPVFDGPPAQFAPPTAAPPANPFASPPAPPQPARPPYGPQYAGPQYAGPQYAGPPQYGTPPQYGGPPGYGVPQQYAPPPQTGWDQTGWTVPDDPVLTLRTSAARAAAASRVLWTMLVGWVFLAAAGLAFTRAASAEQQDSLSVAFDREAAGDLLAGLGWFVVIGLGVAVWALLALWVSWSARAERAVAGPGAAPGSGRAWWGTFVPLASVVLPMTAYAGAARFVGQAHRGQRSVPRRLQAWWVTWVVASVSMGVSSVIADSPGESFTAEAVFLIVAGVTGAVSSALGALALRDLAAAAREVLARSAPPVLRW